MTNIEEPVHLRQMPMQSSGQIGLPTFASSGVRWEGERE